MATLAECVGSGWRHDKVVIESMVEKGVAKDKATAERALLLAVSAGDLVVTSSNGGETAYRLKSDFESKTGDSWLIKTKA